MEIYYKNKKKKTKKKKKKKKLLNEEILIFFFISFSADDCNLRRLKSLHIIATFMKYVETSPFSI